MELSRPGGLVAALCLIANHAGAVPVLNSPTTTYDVEAPTIAALIDTSNTYTQSVSVDTTAATAAPAAPSLVAPNYRPPGGIYANGTSSTYRVTSEYDKQSLALALYQEWTELDYLQQGFSAYEREDFDAAGLTSKDRDLLGHMASQESSHATTLANMLGSYAPVRCTYNYPHSNVREYLDFGQKLTRWGESGVYGFLPHLDSRDAAQIILQTVSTEARQQMVFRQYNGLHPMPVHFETGIPQSWAWTFLAPYIASCPTNQTRLQWQNYPKLTIINQPNAARIDASHSWNETRKDAAGTLSTEDVAYDEACGVACMPAITHTRHKPLSYAGRDVFLQWDTPGQTVGPDNSYVTSTSAGAPLFAAWISQLNVTYTPLLDVTGNSGHTYQPNTTAFGENSGTNGTMFIAITDAKVAVSPFDLDNLNPHVVALGLYQAG